MKTNTRNLCATSWLGLSLAAIGAPYLVPNGDFSLPDGENWNTASEVPETIFTFETTGGSGGTGGYGKIDNSAGGAWAVLIQEGGTGPSPAEGGGIPLSSLGSGLVAGEQYTFSLDMIDLDAGATMAGLKIESWNETDQLGNSGDNLTAITDSWTTYSYDYTIVPGATRLKFVPVISGGDLSAVGFDNVGGDDAAEEPPPFVPIEIENGDFEIAGGQGWAIEGTGSFETTGGNPGGHVLLSRTPDFSAAFAFGGAEVTFASLGLEPGEVYVVNFDMKVISGSGGGVTLIGPAGFTDGGSPALDGDGSEWASYSIELTVPASPGQAKIGLAPNPGAEVAFDNVSLGATVSPAEEVFCINISQGNVITWVPTVPENSYQLQSSDDGVTYEDLGPLNVGDAVSSFFDEEGSAFYQVVESMIEDRDDLINGGFEDVSPADDLCADGWVCVTGDEIDQFATRLALDNDEYPEALATPDQVRTGNASMQLKVENAETGATPGKSLTQQNIELAGGSITPGDSYTFAFWAKQVSTGPSYVQGYKMSWLGPDETGIVGETISGSFAAGTGSWVETSISGLVPPPSATSAIIEIFAETGAVDGGFGEVLIDDVSLSTTSNSEVGIIPAMAATGAILSWETQNGFGYQLQSSSDLASGFSDLGSMMTGNGGTMSVGQTLSGRQFFQVVESTP